MQVTVVGNLGEAFLLIDSLRESVYHSLGVCCVEAELLHQMQQAAVPFTTAATAEDAIAAARNGLLIVAEADAEQSVQVIRRATQEECPVLALPPLDVSTAWSYEVHLLLDEAAVGVIPVTGRWFVDPALRQMELSNVQQLTLSLALPADPQQQRRHQLHAIDLMVGTGLRFSQVTGLDLNGPGGRPLTRTITLGAAATDSVPVPPALIRFEAKPPESASVAVDLVGGGRSSFGVRPPLGSALSIDTPLIEDLVRAVTDRDRCQTEMERLSNTLELLEGLDKSFRRRRTVDVYLDSVSERAVFKTQMTAIGCGVLAYLIFGMVAYLMIAQLLKPAPAVLNLARILWIAPLVLFLLAQLLLPLARDRAPAPTAPAKDAHEDQ